MKVAVVGAGWMGGVHAQTISATGDSVALVIDRDPDRARALADKAGASTAVELAAAKGCEAAVVTTPSCAHLEQATELATMEIPVLVEKPHRLPFEDAGELRAALRRSGSLFRVGLTTRFHPGIRRLKAALDAGSLAEIIAYSDSYRVRLEPGTLSDWYFSRTEAGGGVVTTNGVHLIDRACWLLGGRPEVEAAEGLVPLIAGHDVEDHAQVRLRVNRTEVQLSLLWTPFETGPPELCVVGRRGIARVGLDSWRIETEDGVDEGRSDMPGDAFVAQWHSFRGRILDRQTGPDCPSLDTMEITMQAIADIYRRFSRYS